MSSHRGSVDSFAAKSFLIQALVAIRCCFWDMCINIALVLQHDSLKQTAAQLVSEDHLLFYIAACKLHVACIAVWNIGAGAAMVNAVLASSLLLHKVPNSILELLVFKYVVKRLHMSQ